jgi:hypothetical protein
MDQATNPPDEQAAWQSDQSPCVYCGQVISRTEERCPHCKTSFSVAVRKASREIIGPWYYLDARNPSGRGVTFEALIKMIEKGRIKADSIVRGPTTHQDWMYAAETPRLAKYLAMCPHCFAEAKPEDIYCTRCQLNMNARPAEPRPGVPADLAREPVHRAAYELEKQLAESVSPTQEALSSEPLDIPAVKPAPQPEPAPAPVVAAVAEPVAPVAERATPRHVAAAAAAERQARTPAPGAAERPGRSVAASHGIGLWIGLGAAAVVVIGLVITWAVIPQDWKDHAASSTGTTGQPAKPNEAWVNEQLKEAGQAVTNHDYPRAIQIYEAIAAKTGDSTWDARRQELEQKIIQERTDRKKKLVERLQMAENMAKSRDFDGALAVLRSIGPADRAFLAALKGSGGESVGISVDAMEKAIRDDQVKYLAQKQQEEQLATALVQAGQFVTAKKYQEAVDAYTQIKAAYPADLILKIAKTDVSLIVQDLQARLAAAKIPEPPKTPTGQTPEQAAGEIADLLGQAAAAEKKENFKLAIQILESIKTKYEQKYWPDTLEKRIQDAKAKQEALQFFGMEGAKKAKTP